MAQAKQNTELTTVKSLHNAVPAHLAGLVLEDAGKGISTAQEDNLVPLIYILQALSPQVNKRNPSYIEGAEAGSIWLRNSASPIVDGEQGILFQPCYFTKDWVEWVPRDAGGGYVARHREFPAGAKKSADPKNPNKVKYIMPNGNELIETRYHIGFAITDAGPLPYVIPMISSGHTVSRQWMFLMNAKHHNGKKLPSWSCLYKLRTKERSNAAGTWFTWDVSDGGWVSSPDDYARGKTLYEAFSSGSKAIAEDDISHGSVHEDDQVM